MAILKTQDKFKSLELEDDPSQKKRDEESAKNLNPNFKPSLQTKFPVHKFQFEASNVKLGSL